MEGTYPTAEVQSVYSTVPADWAKKKKNVLNNDFIENDFIIKIYWIIIVLV